MTPFPILSFDTFCLYPCITHLSPNVSPLLLPSPSPSTLSLSFHLLPSLTQTDLPNLRLTSLLPTPTDSPQTPLLLLPYSLETFLTTLICMHEYLYWPLSARQKIDLTTLYGPYILLCMFVTSHPHYHPIPILIHPPHLPPLQEKKNKEGNRNTTNKLTPSTPK